MRLIVLGPPGAGKGTQISKISAHFQLKSISTGDLLRENIKNNTKLGQLAKNIMDEGGLVPSELINQLVDSFIESLQPEEGFILDGYPRNTEQAKALEEILLNRKVSPIEKAIYIDVPDEEIVKRLSGRLTCSACNAAFHKDNRPPLVAGICDICGEKLITRNDDMPATIENRLKVYQKETMPLIDFYDRAGVLYTINGVNDIDNITKQLIVDLSDLS